MSLATLRAANRRAILKVPLSIDISRILLLTVICLQPLVHAAHSNSVNHGEEIPADVAAALSRIGKDGSARRIS